MPFWQRMYGVSLRISWGQCSAKALHKEQPKPQGCVGAASINHVRCTPQATALDDLVLRLKSQTMTMETQSCDLQSKSRSHPCQYTHICWSTLQHVCKIGSGCRTCRLCSCACAARQRSSPWLWQHQRSEYDTHSMFSGFIVRVLIDMTQLRSLGTSAEFAHVFRK